MLQDTVSGLYKKHMPKKIKKKGSWWLWRSSTNQNAGDSSSSYDPSMAPTSSAQSSVAIPVLKGGDHDNMSSKMVSIKLKIKLAPTQPGPSRQP
jgi:hypothetical protein